MTNNAILKKIRYALELRDAEMVAIFKHTVPDMSRSWLSTFFKEEQEPDYQDMDEKMLYDFLDGLITEMREPREGA